MPRQADNHGERMSAVDRAWLEMDEPNNPMVVTAVLDLHEVADVQDLGRHIIARLLHFRRFRQHVDRSVDPPVWRDVGDLLMPYHVRIFHLTEDCPEHGICRAVAREVARGLDHDHPLWQLTLFLRDDGRVTVLFRAHHAIADGVALIGVLMRCTDAAPEARPSRSVQPIRRLLQRFDAATGALRAAVRMARDRARWREHLSGPLHSGREAALAIGRVLSLPDDNPGCLRRPLSGERLVAWTGALPFAPIKARARRLDVKINDLFLAALAGAVGRYLHETHPDEPAAQNLRISIPVNLRRPVDGELGNCFGLVLLDLPVGVDGWRSRVQLVAQRMAALKRSPEARAMLMGLAVAGRLPVTWEKSLVNYLAGKSAAVVSNLPGPRQRLTIAGARLGNLVFWPPQTAGIGLGVSLFSYDGHVTVGVSADTAMIADPARIVALFEDELARILQPRKHAKARRLRQQIPQLQPVMLPETTMLDAGSGEAFAQPAATAFRTVRATGRRPSSDPARAPGPAPRAQAHRG